MLNGTMYKILLAVFAVTWIQTSQAQDICTSAAPDFSAPGRRVSEQKCREYNWERKKVQQCLQDGEVNEYAYMGAVAHRKNDEVIFPCASVLISPKFVVTVAHCARESALGFIRFGAKNIEDKVEHIDMKVIKTIIHPDYKKSSYAYDIAVMELEKELTITKAVVPACLWSGPEDTKQSGIVPGWARTEADGESVDNTKTLRTMKGQAMDEATCVPIVQKWYNRKWSKLENHQICVNESENGRDILCQGLSGSPLVTKVTLDDNPNDVMPYAIAFSQFGSTKCNNGLSIYMRASSFIDWIESIVWPAN